MSSPVSSTTQSSQLKYKHKLNENKNFKLSANKQTKSTSKYLKKVESNAKLIKCDKKDKQINNKCINKSVNKSKHKINNGFINNKNHKSSAMLTTREKKSIKTHKPKVPHLNHVRHRPLFCQILYHIIIINT